MLRIPDFPKQVGGALFIAALLLPAFNLACGLTGDHERLVDRFNLADRTHRWSGDGATIVVNIHDRIYTVRASGGELRRIPKERHDGQYSPLLSPQGRIAYVDQNTIDLGLRKRTRYHLETMDLDGDSIKRLAKVTPRVRPILSPDGSQIAYPDVAETPEGLLPTIRLVAIDGSGQTEFGTIPLSRIIYMVWHGNGHRIAVKHWAAVTTVEPATSNWHIVDEARGT
ncbi:MAG: hypothetical protein F4W95_10430 [Chloroflexi bacterium]|nr:hypothetical protein [Chloroflexota bacterium]MYD48888.1 hypothetical protein [Chloroflexota bacterium]